MNNRDLFEMAIKNLWRRKLRTFLTVLGVVIGASSIIVMLSLGFGLSESQKQQIESMGSLTTITVNKSYGNFDSKTKKELNEKAVSSFNKLPNVVGVMPVKQDSGRIIAGKYIADIPIKGVPPETMDLFEFKLAEGRLLNSSDKLSFVFGGGVKYGFFNPKNMNNFKQPDIDLMKDKLSFTFDDGMSMGMDTGNASKNKEYKIEAVGLLEEGDFETDWAVYIPIHTLEKLQKEKVNNSLDKKNKVSKEFDSVMVKVDNIENVKAIQDTIKDMGYEAHSLTEFLDEMKNMSRITQFILGGIGGVSLLIAAIGITNTMIMSIYERTKEIGIMKVIGASLKDIRKLFLLESAFIGLFGGIVGVVLSYLISYIINQLSIGLVPGVESSLSLIPIWLAGAAVIFSSLIGILSGYYPAKRAMNLSALQALSSE